MFSDELVEAHNPEREMFGMEPLRSLLEEHNDAETMISFLQDFLTAFTGSNWEQ